MRAFILTQKAKDDLLSIGRYTHRQWGKVQQICYLTQLDSAFHDLADKPDIGRACDEIREGYFKYGIGKHVIFYRHVGKSQIEIVRILHGRMDIERHLQSAIETVNCNTAALQHWNCWQRLPVSHA